MDTALVAAIIAAIVAVFCVWFGNRYVVAKSSVDRAIQMHEFFDSNAMIDNRSKAFKTVRESPDKLFSDYELGLVSPDYDGLYNVAHFYQRLSILVQTGQIDTENIHRFFGETFVWWYYISFEQNLIPTGWTSAEDVRKLYQWMRSRMLRSSPQLWKRWHQQAEEDRKRYKLPDRKITDENRKKEVERLLAPASRVAR